MITVVNRVPGEALALGLVALDGIDASSPAPVELVAALDALLARRASAPLSAVEERRRGACRQALKHGRYRATGRGKPASEYLLRAALEDGGAFPRISGPVDAINLVSLAHMLPVSLWDLDLAGSASFEFRLGEADERYVFNAASQQLELADLVCGCALDPPADGGAPPSRPLITPIKDSLATKVRADTQRAAACVYLPLCATTAAEQEAITADLLRSLRLCCGATPPDGVHAVVAPGTTTEL